MNQAKDKSSVSIPVIWLVIWCSVTALLSCARLRQADFGAHGDLPVHYHLLRAFWRSTQEGDWFPQWAGLLDGGRGDAFFTFYPPLSYWLGVLLMKASGCGVLAALKGLTVLALFGSQLSAYLLARTFFARKPGLMVSLGYVSLPTFALIGLHRAFLPNILALSILPLVLCSAHALLSGEKRWRYFGWFALSFSALILTHVITTYLCGWLLLLLTLCHAPRHHWPRLLGATVCALALTSFFWLPQQLEMRWVQVGLQLTQQDFHNHLLFAPLTQDTPFRRAWTGLNELASWMTLLQTGLCALLAALLWRVTLSPAQQVIKRWALGVSVIGLLIALPWAAPLWRIIPGLPYIQFPWRWQPFVALSAALLAALVWSQWPQVSRARRLWLTPGALLCGVCLVILTWQIRQAPAPEFASGEVLTQLNQRAFAPVPFETARALPDDLKPLRLALTANQVYFRPQAADRMLYPPREDYGGLTILRGRGTISAQQLTNQLRRFKLEASEPLQVRVETYAYPHWTAQIDGQTLPHQSEPATGLMLFELPAGTHSLTLQFAPRTLAYRCARFVSIAAWLTFLGWTLAQVWRRRRTA